MRTLIFTFAIATTTACGVSSTPEADTGLPVAEVPARPAIEVVTSEPAAPVVEATPIEVEVPSDAPELVASPPAIPKTKFTLRRGETLAHFARWSEIPVEDIAQSSGLDLDGTYAVGTELAIELDAGERSAVELRRDAHHQTRAENYLASRGATGTHVYKVRTGDNAWTIAQDGHGMPVWLLESLNPSVDLNALRPGVSLTVPVFNDIVVEAPAETEDPHLMERAQDESVF